MSPEEIIQEALARYERPLISHAKAITGDLESARDAVQETFLRLSRQDVSALAPRLAPWLFLVCKNCALDHLRKVVRFQEGPLEDNHPANGRSPSDEAEIREETTLLAQPLSTFSIDVDTASYSNVRRFLNAGQLPPPDAVRIEELINYFPYSDPQPEGDRPFSINLETARAPWDPEHELVRIGIQGRQLDEENRPPSNLVFLVDVSGSMRPENKLPLLKRSLRALVGKLGEDDRVAIVTYAGSSGLALPSTPGTDKQRILQALDRLGAGGSTNGAKGIALAYRIARENFLPEGSNRVILCTDGNFNVGVTSQNRVPEPHRKSPLTGRRPVRRGSTSGMLPFRSHMRLAQVKER